MLIQLKKEIKKANGQIRLSELSRTLQVQPSVIEGMLVALYGKDVLKSNLETCADPVVCPSCRKNCPFAKAH